MIGKTKRCGVKLVGITGWHVSRRVEERKRLREIVVCSKSMRAIEVQTCLFLVSTFAAFA